MINKLNLPRKLINTLNENILKLGTIGGGSELLPKLILKFTERVSHLTTNRKALHCLEVSKQFINGEVTLGELYANVENLKATNKRCIFGIISIIMFFIMFFIILIPNIIESNIDKLTYIPPFIFINTLIYYIYFHRDKGTRNIIICVDTIIHIAIYNISRPDGSCLVNTITIANYAIAVSVEPVIEIQWQIKTLKNLLEGE